MKLTVDQDPTAHLFKRGFKRVDLFNGARLESIDEATELNTVLQMLCEVNLVLDVAHLLSSDLLYPCHAFLRSLRAEFSLSLVNKRKMNCFLRHRDTEIALYGIAG